ncbi:hypothetical protein EC2719100_3301 [Escherichia coli 2719100]|nr:hypothetical protein ECP03018671_3292 [Escherichia coli P0301867.1]EMX84583.1 hypothetical protein EC2719100_3301 [Escherichia coli 2719100]ENA38829.1 hypothetical protein ECP03018674_3011 [Escherichia coli P0301867.4]ENA44305.1 hypothetical protein ECP03018672_3042 [Escherichia coli P0301867.2]ENA60924.1 hypothetical protein EC178900_2946 [Escherichia coli 178900]ENC90455.1 hypothetical protein ECP030186711_3041 [Escherichia coli P0301867.11]END90762.1 hypothetical protein ECP030186713_31
MPLYFIYSAGLSPLTRGTLTPKCPANTSARFIPADAGNSKLNMWLILLIAVYPR